VRKLTAWGLVPILCAVPDTKDLNGSGVYHAVDHDVRKPHAWLEERGPGLTLFGLVDDATDTGRVPPFVPKPGGKTSTCKSMPSCSRRSAANGIFAVSASVAN